MISQHVRLTSAHRQHGNTLTGFIVGLIVGLAIAVAVALAITKGATPFTDKSAKNGKSQEPTPGQISDPNKPLYGSKDAAREANKDFAKEPKEAKEPKPPAPDALQQIIAAVKPDAPVKPEPKAEAAPKPPVPDAAKAALADAAKAGVAAAKPDGAPPGEEKFVYYLQAGAFRETVDAEGARAKLALLGFEAAITDRSTDSGVLHRVRLGPYNQIEAMNKARSKLSENGVDVAVVRNQK